MLKTYEDYLGHAIRKASLRSRALPPGECQSADGRRCNLCYAVNLSYEDELALRVKPLQEFWKSSFREIPLAPLIVSPLGRFYRTVSKRKAFHRRDGTRLGLINPEEDGKETSFAVAKCAIEPEEHARIYGAVQSSLEKPYAREFTKALNYAVIKGGYAEFTLIFSVAEISPTIVKAANTLSKSLTRFFPQVTGLFLYADPSRGRYYLGTSNPRANPIFRKIHGKSEVYQQLTGRTFLYSPLSFSQVNQSILELMIAEAGRLLGLTKNQTLYDLYCGYGLFSLCFADKVKQVVGVELSSESIDSAIANAKRNGVANARFIRSDIIAESLSRILKNASPEDAVLLDPPRNGTASGVVEAIAARRPAKVLHIFCNIDLIATELARWKARNYHATQAVPLDLFPGTASLEVMVLLERK